MDSLLVPKNEHKFYCKICNYSTKRKSQYDRHILTAKHIKNKTNDELVPKSSVPTFECECGNSYKYRQGLVKHRRVCSLLEDTTNEVTTPSIIIEILKQNKELQNTIVEQNKELKNTIIELSKQATIVNNTTNNHFNLNVFLNEDCKNALNIAEFVDSLNLTVSDIEETGKLGYTQGITRIFVQGLKNLDVNRRPFHCTDIKRETVYIKDSDTWEKENAEKTKLRNVLKQIARKNLKMLPAWQELNPEYRHSDTPENEQFIQISLNSLGPSTKEDEIKQQDKIIRNVLKNVTIDKVK
jgi:hypothetical protein